MSGCSATGCCHDRHDSRVVRNRRRPLRRPRATAAASTGDGVPPRGHRVRQLTAKLAPGETVQVEVDGVVGVHQQEGGGLVRHHPLGQFHVDVSNGEDESERREWRRQDKPGE